MNNAGPRASSRFNCTLLVLPILLTGGVAAAENIDPGGNGLRYAWGKTWGGSTRSLRETVVREFR